MLNLQLIDTKKNGVHHCNPFRNSNLIFDLTFHPGICNAHFRIIRAGCVLKFANYLRFSFSHFCLIFV